MVLCVIKYLVGSKKLLIYIRYIHILVCLSYAGLDLDIKGGEM